MFRAKLSLNTMIVDLDQIVIAVPCGEEQTLNPSFRLGHSGEWHYLLYSDACQSFHTFNHWALQSQKEINKPIYYWYTTTLLVKSITHLEVCQLAHFLNERHFDIWGRTTHLSLIIMVLPTRVISRHSFTDSQSMLPLHISSNAPKSVVLLLGKTPRSEI